MYLFLIGIGIISSLFIMLRTIRVHGPGGMVMRPIFIFTIFFCIIHFIVPGYKYIEGIYRYRSQYDEQSFVIVSFISIFSLFLAYFLSRTKLFSPYNIKNNQIITSKKKSSYIEIYASIAIFLIGLLFAIMDIRAISSMGIESFQADRHASADARGSFRLLTNLMLLGLALYIASSLSMRLKSHLVIIPAATMLTFMIYYYFIINSRNSALIAIILALCAWIAYSRSQEITIKKTSNKKKIVSTIFIFIISVVGINIFESMSRDRYSRSESSYTTERREKLIFYALDGAFGNDENIIWLHENDYDLQYGATYLAGILNIVPRSVWPGKPLGAGPRLINMIRPGSYIHGAYGNNSLTTGMLTEGYMNFGYLGVPIAILIWAYFSSRCMRRFHRSNNTVISLSFLILSIFFSSAFLYQEFLGFFSRIIMIVAPLLIIGGIKLSPKRTQRYAL